MNIAKEIRRVAHTLKRHTVMACAFMRAIGMRTPPPEAKRGDVVSVEYADLMECFANHGSPMDL